jgi:cation:H+ antiporter
MDDVVLWLKFLAAAGVVVGAGLALTRSAERLATAMGWGHAFAGFVVLGWATSLPEVTISVSAITDVGSPGLATANITGSIIFNLAILALLDQLAARRRPGADSMTSGVLPLGLFNLVMISGTLVFFLNPELMGGGFSRVVGAFLLGLYLLATAHAWRTQSAEDSSREAAPVSPQVRRERLIAGGQCLLAGAAILLAGVWLARIGDELATTYSLGEGLVGTIFLATVSSLPELVTGLAAVRLGLLTMAAGSILGSNIFNLGILGVCDLIYQSDAPENAPLIVAAQGDGLSRSLLAALVMTALAMLTMHLRRTASSGRRKALFLAITFWASMLVYFAVLTSVARPG